MVFSTVSIILTAIFSIYFFAVFSRFSIASQRMRAMFNPVYNLILKSTEAPVGLINKLLPKTKIDISSLIFAYVISLIYVGVLSSVMGVFSVYEFAWAGIVVLSCAKSIVYFGMILLVVVSWIAPQTNNPALEVIQAAFEPMLNLARKIIPAFGGIDLSPILIFVVVMLLNNLILYPLKMFSFFPSAFPF